VVETRDFFESTVVDPRAGQIDPEGTAVIRHKPEETPVTLAAKKSRLGQVYLDWAQYPVVEADRLPDEDGYQVEFIDLRFARITSDRRPFPLAGYVILDSKLRVVDMYVGGLRRGK
jgi:inner membrane protein